MRIRIIRDFNDMTRGDEDNRVAAGKEITVTADRGAELIGLGLAEPIDDTPAAPASDSH